MKSFREFVKGKVPSLRNILLIFSMLSALAHGVNADELSVSKEQQPGTEQVAAPISQREVFKHCTKEMKQKYHEIEYKSQHLADLIKHYCHELDKFDKLDPTQESYHSKDFLKTIKDYTNAVEKSVEVLKDINTGNKEKIKAVYDKNSSLNIETVLNSTITNLNTAEKEISRIGNAWLDVLGINKLAKNRI